MLKPSEFGLPEKFTEFRKSQFEIAAKKFVKEVLLARAD